MEDLLLHVFTYVCAKCCYPQKLKSLLSNTYLLKKYPQNLHTPKKIHISETPKISEIQNFLNPKN